MGIVLLFIKKNWKFFVGIAITLAFAFAVNSYLNRIKLEAYTEGQTAQAAADKEEFDKMQKRYDDKIAWLENLSSELAVNLAKTNADNAARVAEVDKQVASKLKALNQTIYDSFGKEIACTPGMDLYLGLEFSNTWNKYNTGVLK